MGASEVTETQRVLIRMLDELDIRGSEAVAALRYAAIDVVRWEGQRHRAQELVPRMTHRLRRAYVRRVAS